MFGSIYENEGLDRNLAVDRAQRTFCQLDIDSDGDITEEEFIRVDWRVMVVFISWIRGSYSLAQLN